ncbi:ubiquinol oxidase subunit II [Buchnera aphidicola]|uniref:Ubiquinol oxidase subunit 2 n=1 Tax=Buchnera aphidicola (Cinara strobi) TaxID=1921549 RepID=A0A3B1E2S7_9GAMM|nr:ubiquinol oxidase subunit II [Buchnera aphidicola]VAX76736.1 Cytochrome bo(3) ubiquinol oxidase subunit 2 [Buchnera aphidicola (Cinara strobi)]
MIKLFNKNNILKFLSISFILVISLFVMYFSNNIHMYSDGYILHRELKLALVVFKVMLLVVIPVISLVSFIAYYYRESNIFAAYKPDWTHSYFLETICWLVPIIIIIFLADLSWKNTHKLEPSKCLCINSQEPIIIDVVSLNWRWLFIYPQYKIATINEIYFPKNTSIYFRITSHSVMNSFFIPGLGTQIYTMAGMKTELNLFATRDGLYKGISSNYSGRGFSNMKFNVYVKNNLTEFHEWVNKVKSKNNFLIFKQQFLKLSCNNEKYHVQYFSYVDPLLFYKIISIFNKSHCM